MGGGLERKFCPGRSSSDDFHCHCELIHPAESVSVTSLGKKVFADEIM